MPRSVEIVRVEADIDEFLRRPRSAHRRFTRVSLCYLQHIEKTLYDGPKSADIYVNRISMLTKIVITQLIILYYYNCFSFF